MQALRTGRLEKSSRCQSLSMASNVLQWGAPEDNKTAIGSTFATQLACR